MNAWAKVDARYQREQDEAAEREERLSELGQGYILAGDLFDAVGMVSDAEKLLNDALQDFRNGATKAGLLKLETIMGKAADMAAEAMLEREEKENAEESALYWAA